MKILWLGDEEVLQTIIVSLLKKNDGVFDIEFVVDGDAAIKRYREHGVYDLVMTDYLHSGLNGLEFSRTIRNGNPLQAIAVFTATRTKQMMRGFQRLHVPVLLKPCNAQELGQFVSAAALSKKTGDKTPRF